MGINKVKKDNIRILESSKEEQFRKLIHNDVLTPINIKSINSIKEKIDNFIIKIDKSLYTGYRIKFSKAFNTFGFKIIVDLVVCDDKNEVIETYTSLEPQKTTKYFDNAKYIYLFSENVISYFKITKGDILYTIK